MSEVPFGKASRITLSTPCYGHMKWRYIRTRLAGVEAPPTTMQGEANSTGYAGVSRCDCAGSSSLPCKFGGIDQTLPAPSRDRM